MRLDNDRSVKVGAEDSRPRVSIDAKGSRVWVTVAVPRTYTHYYDLRRKRQDSFDDVPVAGPVVAGLMDMHPLP